MPHPFELPGGRYLWATQYIRATREMFNAMGGIANQALFNLVCARLFGARSGVFDGGDFLVTENGGNLEVAAGLGLYHDATASDPHELVYKPFVQASVQTLVLDEADATHDRIDVVSVAPAEVDDTSETVWVRSSGNLSPQDINTRRRFGASLVVTGGTASADPDIPAPPAGHIKLAEVRVLAGGAGFVITDHRPILTLGRDVRPVPGEPYVVEGLEPSLSGGAVLVAAGVAEIDGDRFRYAPAELAPTANGTGATRYDLVVAQDDGTLALVAGTGAPPTLADEPDGSVLLGYAAVNTTGTVTAVTDLRETGTIGAAQLRAGAVVGALEDGEVPGAKLETGAVTTPKLAHDARPIYPALTYEGNNGLSDHFISIQIRDADGNAVQREVDLLIGARTNTWDLATGQAINVTGSGSVVEAIQDYLKIVRTAADGSAELTVFNGSSPGGQMVRLDVTTRNQVGGNAILSYSVAITP